MDAALRGTCRYCGAVTDLLVHARTITEQVAAEHRVPAPELYARNRRAHIVAARACAIRRIREETGLKLMAIGDLFGLNHSTIIHHLNGKGEAAAVAETSGAAQG